MAARSKARRRAVEILFEADVRESVVDVILTSRMQRADPPVAPYTVDLVQGVTAHRRRIDELLEEYAEGWTLERMPPVDRAILRVGLYELLWCDDVPEGVVLDQAVEMATSLSTDDSPRFVNGLLATLGSLKGSLATS